jgi:nucleoside-diphosphate-sugar epimerase
MRVLVTGAGGFIGRSCVAEFLARGWQVRAISRQVLPDAPGLESVQIRALEEVDWSRLIKGIDCVVHLAGVAHQGRKSTDHYHAINVEVTERLAVAAVDADVKRLIFLSSIAVYGRLQSGRIDDFSDLSPEDDNGRSKAAAERRIREISKDGGLAWTIVRVPMVYGPNAPGNFHRLEKLVRSAMPLPLAAATAPRSYLGIGNLVSALTRIAASPAAKNRTYLLADGDDLGTAKLIQLMADAIGIPCRLWWLPPGLIRVCAVILGRRGDADRVFGQLSVDGKAVRKELNWMPPWSAAEGIRLAMRAGGAQQKRHFER